MDQFCDSDLFDEDVSLPPSPEAEDDTDPLATSIDGDSRRLDGRRTTRLIAFVFAALVMLLIGGFALRVTGGPTGQHAGAIAERHHPKHPARAHAHRPTAVHHPEQGAQAPAPLGPSRVIVDPPSRGAERPTRDESVGSGRPSSPSVVGKTEQFAYLGR
jgi:hypothetical protein